MNCYFCGSDNLQLVSEKLRYKTESKVYKCGKCSLVQLYPLMDADEEKKFYEEEYGSIFSKEKDANPETIFQKQLKGASFYLDLCKDELKSSDKCLEVGCASGYFLYTIKDMVAETTGIESFKDFQAICKDKGISICNSIDECENNYFDKIFLFFVLEHIGDPLKMLGELAAKLKSDGTIYVMIPNVNDPIMSVYGVDAFKDFYFTPAHQFYYSPDSLKAVVEKTGLKLKIDLIQRYGFDNHVNWIKNGKPGADENIKNMFDEKFLQSYKANMEKCGATDTIFARITK